MDSCSTPLSDAIGTSAYTWHKIWDQWPRKPPLSNHIIHARERRRTCSSAQISPTALHITTECACPCNNKKDLPRPPEPHTAIRTTALCPLYVDTATLRQLTNKRRMPCPRRFVSLKPIGGHDIAMRRLQSQNNPSLASTEEPGQHVVLAPPIERPRHAQRSGLMTVCIP